MIIITDEEALRAGFSATSIIEEIARQTNLLALNMKSEPARGSGDSRDTVQEVLDLEPANIVAAPKIGTKLNTEFISGMGKRDDGFVIILDIDKVFSVDEIAQVQSTQTQTGQG